MKRAIFINYLVVVATSNLFSQQGDFPKLTGTYLGQKQHRTPSLSGQATAREPLLLTYIANMGVLVSSGDSKILIDGLFNKPNSYCRVPTPETLESIIKGEAPFDSIDLVLVTHKHSDHFDATLAVRYLETHGEPILIAPSDAVAELRKVAPEWSKIEQRNISVDLKVEQHIMREAACIPLTVVRTLHANDKAPMNLMYLIEVNGWQVFHAGDWMVKPDDFLKFGLGTVPIDYEKIIACFLFVRFVQFVHAL